MSGVVATLGTEYGKDPVDLLHTLSTDDLIALHNKLSGGAWLKRVRGVLNFRNVWESEKIRKGVDPFSYDVISGRTR